MRRFHLRFLAAALSVGGGAHAAPPPPSSPPPAPPATSEAPADEEDAIVVNGRRAQPGAVVGDIAPELQYGPADIRALGVGSVSELLSELSPETTSLRGDGAPVVLLNGRRISGFSEIRDIPTEAILRVDILPEEVALKYGYTADQKVVNIVLRRRFRALTTEATAATSSEGGGAHGSVKADVLRIHGDSRFNLDVKYQDHAALTEAERGILSAAPATPYDLAGNVTAAMPGAPIGSLSAAAGVPVMVAAVPAGVADPTLAGFVSGVNRPAVTDPAPYRTLVPASHEWTANAVLARPIGQRVTATINGTLDWTRSQALRGLAGTTLLLPAADPFSPFGEDVLLDRYISADPLRQTVDSVSTHLGTTLNADAGDWRLSLTAGYDHGETHTLTGTGLDLSAFQAALIAGDPGADPFGPVPAGFRGTLRTTHAAAISNSGDAEAVATGPLVTLPTGDLRTTAKIGLSDEGFVSTSERAGASQRVALSRREGNVQLNVDLPLTSRKDHVLGAIGDLSANLNLAARQLSDFGTLTTLGYGLNWKPRDGVALIGSVTRSADAPSVQQLGDPVVVTPAVPVYDFATGRTVDVIETAGGNPKLRADDRLVERLGFTLKPWSKTDLTFRADYVFSHIGNAIASFPVTTAAIEAAFPDRFTRDPDGDLAAIDERPVNFADERRQELRYGFTYTRRLKSSTKLIETYRQLRRDGAFGFGRRGGGGAEGARTGGSRRAPGVDAAPTPGHDASGQGGPPPHGPGPAEGDGAPPPGGRWRGRGGPGGGRGGFSGGRLQLGLYHTVYFRDDILVRPGVAPIDLLNGGATGSGGGQPRHKIELQLGYANNGLGARLTGQWQSGTRVLGADGDPGGDLRFSPLATANFRLFADLGQQPALARHAWARGMRLTLSVTNLFDRRQHVVDGTGLTPLGLQPAYLDPLGRTIQIGLRKLLF